MEARMGLMRRIPSKHSKIAISTQLSLLPSHSINLLSRVDQPLQKQPILEMDNGDDRVTKKRKIEGQHGSEGFINDSLALSLSLQPFVPMPEPPPIPATSPTLGRLYSPRPPPPPSSIPDCLELFPISNPGSLVPSTPPPPVGIYPELYGALSLQQPVYGLFFSPATVNSQIALRAQPQRPRLTPPPPQEPTLKRDGPETMTVRSRRNPEVVKSVEIAPPYPWAMNRRAKVHSLPGLLSSDIHIITGFLQCKFCQRNYEIGFDIRQKLPEIFQFIVENRAEMRDRAPVAWMNPAFPSCRFCDVKNCARPLIADKKRSVNWLFLLLGQMLGCCTLEQLKYFCKHNNYHRTGAKDRILYQTYLGLCKQLDPNVPF